MCRNDSVRARHQSACDQERAGTYRASFPSPHAGDSPAAEGTIFAYKKEIQRM